MAPLFETSAKWRVGLLVTTIAMGLALASTGISGYLQARKNANTITEVEVMSVLRGLRREMSRSQKNLSEAISAYVEESTDQGLNYVVFLDEKGERLAAFGRAEHALSPGLIAEALRRPAGRHRGPERRGPEPPVIQHVASGIVHAAVPTSRRMFRRRWNGEPEPVVLAIEAVSDAGPRVVASALLALVIALGAAALLLVASLLFWRQSRLAEAHAQVMEEERLRMLSHLERDKRLKALGRMSAVLGHELRNPIAALKGHAQLLLEKLSVDHPGRNQALTVASEATLLENLTIQVLEFVRTGELLLSKVYVDDLAHGAVALSNVAHVAVSGPEGVTWYLDRSRMQEALTNLLVNARQASRSDDPIDIIITAGEEALVIAVRDRGEGIDAGDEERIFQPFHTTKTRGTGLGLALVKRIVEGHGGTISARNHEDKGAVISLTLPKSAPSRRGESDG